MTASPCIQGNHRNDKNEYCNRVVRMDNDANEKRVISFTHWLIQNNLTNEARVYYNAIRDWVIPTSVLLVSNVEFVRMFKEHFTLFAVFVTHWAST